MYTCKTSKGIVMLKRELKKKKIKFQMLTDAKS